MIYEFEKITAATILEPFYQLSLSFDRHDFSLIFCQKNENFEFILILKKVKNERSETFF
jgi:hypothetical protein